MKKINDLIATSIVRKSAFYKVNGYELREKYVNEDWNFWLKLISKGMYPVHISCYGQWYRRKNEGELKKSIENKKRSLEIIKNTSKKINQPVKAIEYPKQDYNYEEIAEKMENMVLPEKIDEKKKNILFILPWMVVGETDRFNLELVKGLDKNKYDITIITTECAVNFLRQQFEEYATVYELGSFLNQKYWFAFVNYIIKKNKIDLIFLSNSEIGYSFLPLIKANNPNIHIIDYVYNEELYNRNDGYLRDSNSVKSVIDKTLTSEFDPNKYNKDKFSMDSVIKKMSDIFDQTIKNTNKELIENGKDLEKHIDLCKELITKTFLIMKAKYTLETDNYKLNYGYSDNYKLSIFKEKMWKYAPYRALIKIAQKFRIIEIIKKIGSRGK